MCCVEHTTVHIDTLTVNHRMAWVGGDSKDHQVPTPRPQTDLILDQVAQGPKPGLECLQGLFGDVQVFCRTSLFNL